MYKRQIRERATDDISMIERANLMVRLHAQVPAVRALVLVDAEGTVVADSTGEIPRGASLAQWSYFRAHRDHAESGLRIDGPVRFDAYREDGVVVSRRLVGYDRRFEGVVLGVITADSLRHLLQYARFGGGQRAFLLQHLRFQPRGVCLLYTSPSPRD